MKMFLISSWILAYYFVFKTTGADTKCTDAAVFEYSDGLTLCYAYNEMKYCTAANHSTWMRKYCQRTCGFCKPRPGPEEINPFQYFATELDANMALSSQTTKSAEVTSLEECLTWCSSEARVNPSSCRSVNFEMVQKSKRICELNSQRKSSFYYLYRARQGFIYYERAG